MSQSHTVDDTLSMTITSTPPILTQFPIHQRCLQVMSLCFPLIYVSVLSQLIEILYRYHAYIKLFLLIYINLMLSRRQALNMFHTHRNNSAQHIHVNRYCWCAKIANSSNVNLFEYKKKPNKFNEYIRIRWYIYTQIQCNIIGNRV